LQIPFDVIDRWSDELLKQEDGNSVTGSG
jgi:hypothetical protein